MGCNLIAFSGVLPEESTIIMKTLVLPILFVASLQAAEFNPGHVSSDASWWLHADFEAVRDTKIGQRVVEAIEKEHAAKLKAVKRMFSLNPVTDIKGITLYGDGGKDRAVALIHADFDRAHLEDLVGAAEDYGSERRGEVTVHSWTDKGKRQHAFFASDDLLVFSHFESLLESAMSTLRSGGMERDPFVSSGTASPFLVASARLSEVEMKGDESELLGHAETLKIALAESGERMEGRMMVGTAERVDGERFRKVMEGMVAIAELGNAVLRDGDMRFETSSADEGRTVNATLSLPSSVMIKLMEKDGAFARMGE